jgi:hypothetical protein
MFMNTPSGKAAPHAWEHWLVCASMKFYRVHGKFSAAHANKKAVAWQELTCGKTAGNIMSDFFSKILVSVIEKVFQFQQNFLKFILSLRALLN